MDPDDKCCVLVVCASVPEEEEDDFRELNRGPSENAGPSTRKQEFFDERENTSQRPPQSQLKSPSKQEEDDSKGNLDFLQITPTTIQVKETLCIPICH